jgi:REP element-mobilizing transposase RayT
VDGKINGGELNLSRTAREKCESGIYHIIARGINRQAIFFDNEDYIRYLETLNKYKNDGKCTVLGYCLMRNHLHLLLQENSESIAVTMKRIGTSYAWWYNKRYDRVGHVFQDRYKSECVEDDAYLLTVIRYIHLNPVKAKITEKPEEYKWSSCRAYYTRDECPAGLTATETILACFKHRNKPEEDCFRQYMEQQSDERCLEYDIKRCIKDSALKREIEIISGGIKASELHSVEKTERNTILRRAKDIPGSNLRQISRVTGIGINIILRA